MPAPTGVDLSILIVSWNVAPLLQRCLRSIVQQSAPTDLPRIRKLTTPAAAGATLEVIVVDNASRDESVTMLTAEFPWVQVIVNADNAGFTRANNQAFAASRGAAALFLNPDTEVSPGALTTLLVYLRAHPNVGVLGPRLRYPDGSIQSSRRRFPTLATALFESTLLEQWWPHNPAARAYRLEDVPDDRAQDVDWLVGACLLVPRHVLDQVGTWDEGFFMYSEELDLCRRIRDAGWRVVYLPQAEVIHYEGKSSEQVVAARHVRFQTSKVRYFAKYHGRLVAEVLRLFLLATYAWQLLEEGIKWLLGHKRPLRASRAGAYWTVLRSGLRPQRR